jgi:hypothetical protein
MPSFVMSLSETIVRTYVSEESVASIIRATRVGELGIMLAVATNQSILRKKKKTCS